MDMMTKRVLAPLLAPLARKLAAAAALLTVAATLAAPANAADMKGEYGARTVGSYPAVPVPAPIPIPDSFNWYVRGDAGFAVKSQGSITVKGPALDIVGASENNGPYQGSIGFGRYITPSLRVEFNLDLRNDQPVVQGRVQHYTFQRVTNGTPTNVTNVGPGNYSGTNIATYDVHTYDVAREENAKNGTTTFMANAYYDLRTGTRFTPYVGAGAGLALTVFKRQYKEASNCIRTYNTWTLFDYINVSPQGDPVTGLPGCIPSAPAATNGGGGSTTNSLGPALALMTGVAVDISPGVKVDAGYRYMWQGTLPNLAMVAVSGDDSVIKIGARSDHELRLGLRWDLW
jgi:opacity protein-like surface antigen